MIWTDRRIGRAFGGARRPQIMQKWRRRGVNRRAFIHWVMSFMVTRRGKPVKFDIKVARLLLVEKNFRRRARRKTSGAGRDCGGQRVIWRRCRFRQVTIFRGVARWTGGGRVSPTFTVFQFQKPRWFSPKSRPRGTP